MGADVAGRPARTRLLGIGAPHRLLGTRRLDALGQPVLRIFGLHHADIAERTRLHHLPGVPHHRIAGVVVGEDEQLARRLHRRGERLRVAEVRRQRLVADDVDAGVQKGLGGGKVHVVGGDDRHRLDAVRPLRLGRRHLGKRTVAAVGIEPQFGSRGLRAVRIRRQRPGHQPELAIEPCRDAVHGADERPLSAAHHAEANGSGAGFDLCCGDHRRTP